MFVTLSDRLQDIFKTLRGRGRLSENDVRDAMREVRTALLEADVEYSVVRGFVSRVRERAVGADVARSLTPGQQVVKIVHEELIETLGKPGRLALSGNPPHVILLLGLQGSGKTTTAAKLALHLQKQGQRPYLIAADTQRPAAIDQLQVLGEQIGVPVYAESPDQPTPNIVQNGIQAASRAAASAIIIDTAGRLQIDVELMAELRKVRDRAKPVETLLVADSMTGQEAVNIARGFNDQIGISGLILTKVDGDARGGAAISMREVTGVPIKFLGTGEKLDGLEVFHPDRLASRILGMGDVMTLIERAEALDMDAEKAAELGEKLVTASFTLEDFREQLQQMKKMGPLSDLMGMMPGMAQAARQIKQDDVDKQLRRVEAIIDSMTPLERRKPKLLNASRRKRIASGSGTSVQEVNQTLRQFEQMQKMMKKLSKDPRAMRGLFG